VPDEPRVQSLRDYLAVISRRRWYVVGAIIAALVVSLGYSYTRTPQYRATAQLTYQKQADALAMIFGSTSYFSTLDVQTELQTSAELFGTQEMARRASLELGQPISSTLQRNVSATVVPSTNVLQIHVVSADPQQAAQVANAYARSFVSWKRSLAVDQIRQAEDGVLKKLQRYTLPRDAANPGYVALQGRLQDLRVVEGMVTGNYSVAAEATVPTSPFSPSHKRDAILGLLAGLLVGIGLAFVADQLDTRVHSQDELSEALQLPVLGRIPPLTRKKDVARSELLVTVGDPSGIAAEAFRMLRGNLDFVNVDGDVRSILVTSCSEGEGKTSTVSNLAVTLVRAGKRVILLEADLRRPKLHRYFEVPAAPGLSDVVAGRVPLADALRSVPLQPVDAPQALETAAIGMGELVLLTAGTLPPNPGEIVTSRRMRSLVEELERSADIVLVDSPPFFAVGDAVALADKVDGLLLVVRMEHVTKVMLKDAATLLRSLPCRRLGIAATNFGAAGTPYHYRYQTEGEAEAAPRPELQGAQSRP